MSIPSLSNDKTEKDLITLLEELALQQNTPAPNYELVYIAICRVQNLSFNGTSNTYPATKIYFKNPITNRKYDGIPKLHQR